jgi:hypothetical protein
MKPSDMKPSDKNKAFRREGGQLARDKLGEVAVLANATTKRPQFSGGSRHVDGSAARS